MLSFLKSDDNQTLQKELQKNYINEVKIQKLIDGGADINQQDENGRTILFDLSKKKRIEAIKILIKNGININHEDRYGKTALMEAIAREDSLMIRFLLDNGAMIDYINSSGRTITQDVALEGNLRILKLLLAKEPDLDLRDTYGKTALFDAVESENIDVLKEILNNLDDVDAVDDEGQTALFDAVLKENSEIAKILIGYGANVHHLDNKGQNVLYNAIVLGADNIELIELLLKKGVKLNLKDNEENTLLDEILKILTYSKDEYLEKEGKYKLVSEDRSYTKLTTILMEHGLAVNRTDKDGRTILFKEVKAKNYDALEFLLQTGADINIADKDGRTVIFDAILEGMSNIRMVDFLLANGADMDQRDNNERTIIDDLIEIILIKENGKKPSQRRLLDIEEEEEYLSLLKRLLAHRPKINIPKKDGRHALFEVINFDNIELIKVLLNNGIDPNLTDKAGVTPLSMLIEEGVKLKRPKEREQFLERLVFLLKFRVNVNAIDKEGKTIFHKAVIADDLEVVEKLLNKRADLKIKDKQGRTALHHTQWKGNFRIARLLIAAGANMDEPDYAGFTVLNYAAILGHTKLVVVLIASGVLMYNHNKKSKAVVKFFLEREANLEKLLTGNITDPKMRKAVAEVIINLKKEIREVK